LGIHGDYNFQSGSSFGNVKVDFVTFSYIVESMGCDSRASLLASTFVSHCFGREPKARVVTLIMYENKSYDKKRYPKMMLNKLKIMGGPSPIYTPLGT
jgi:hypothetical protein